MCASTAAAIYPGFYEDFEKVLQKFQNLGVPAGSDAGSDAESDGSVGTAVRLPAGRFQHIRLRSRCHMPSFLRRFQKCTSKIQKSMCFGRFRPGSDAELDGSVGTAGRLPAGDWRASTQGQTEGKSDCDCSL